MENIYFKSLNELYIRVRPAIRSKIAEFERQNIGYIKENDIWNYLRKTNWNQKQNLELCDMISDIMALDLKEIDNYLKDILSSENRAANYEE